MDYDKLIQAFNGEESEEKDSFFSEILSDKEHLEEAARIKNIWAAAQILPQETDKSIRDRGWNIFRKKIDKRTVSRQWLRVAVVFLICSLGSFMYYLGQNGREQIPVAYHTLSVPAGQYAQLILSDGSEIWLNSRSKLIYPDRFVSETREVSFEGEGFFKVASDKDHPFIVKTKSMEVVATGTQFDVSAYDDDSWISTALIEGNLYIYSKENNINYEIKTGQMAVYNKDEKQISLSVIDPHRHIAWTHGEFSFKEMSLGEIAKRLERNFNVKFVFNNKSVKQRAFTGTFYNHQSIETILKVIKASTSQIRYKIDNEIIYIE